ncbi:MAG TPA: amidohydrolase family protein, partial [Gemmatimonadales bacterium]
MHQPDRRVVLLAAGLILAGPPAAAQQGTWALTNARIETVTRGVIERGTIVIRDGLIAAVGASVPVPADARTLDLAGRTVSPGLIDLASPYALASAPATGGATTGPRFTGIDPQRRVADELRLSPADARSARDAGITAILVAPTRGLFRGQSALVPTRDSASGRDALRATVGQHMGYEGIGQGEYPGSLLGVIAEQRQLLYDAQRHGLIEDRWAANPRGVPRPEADPVLSALVPVVRGTQPLFADARNENQIRRAAALADEFKLRLVVAGATEGWRAVDVLAGRGLAVSVNFPRPTEVTGWRYRGAMRRTPDDSAAADAAARAAIEGNPAALHRAGYRIALTSGGQPSSFLANARKAVAAGLPAAVALEAMTFRAAELAGVGEASGSVEAGKIANLVVSAGP